THDAQVASTARELRFHGSKQRYHHHALGYASRLDELQAAILRVKLPHIEELNRKRKEVAKRYDEVLGKMEGVEIPPRATGDNSHVYHQYTIRIMNGRRDEIHQKLGERGISTMIYYPVPVPHLEVYGQKNDRFPHAEKACSEVLSLPLWPELTPEAQ